MENSFFAYVERMNLIERWALMRCTQKENIAEHSMMVACLAHALGTIHNTVFGGHVDANRLAVWGLYHDMSEVLTGDMPTPIKHGNPQIHQAFGAVEQTAKQKLCSLLPEELQEEYRSVLLYDEASVCGRLVKAADTLSAYIFCVKEGAMGNRDYEQALAVTKERLLGMGLPEVEYFLKQFGDSFGKGLDQL